LRQVYDFTDQADVLAAARELMKIRTTEAWNVLRQRAEILRAEAAAQALDKDVNRDELRGRIEGVFKLLEDADALILQGQRVVEVSQKKAAERGSVLAAGAGPL